MKVCVIGGGLTGLVAAGSLSGMHEIDLFEKRSHTGGCLSSYQIGNYSIERYYHHCFSSDTAFFSLLDSLGLSGLLEWHTASTGYYVDGKIHPLTTPFQILRYPYLTLADKAKLAYLTLRAKSIRTEDLDTISAEQYIRETLGDGIYASFFEPLLNSKFGKNKGNVSAAWLISRVAIRSDRGAGGERLGYIRGGFHNVIAALEEAIRKKGSRIRTQEPVFQLRRTNGRWEVNGSLYDTVISTIPPQELSQIGGPPADSVPYQGAACVTLGLTRDCTEGIYWLNMKDPAPYGAVVTHTSFIPKEQYGEEIIYLASYFSGTLPQKIDRHMIDDFRTRFQVQKDEINWSRVAVDPFAGPVYTLGYRSRMPAYEQGGLFMAGMFSAPNYPERSMEGAVQAGLAVADVAGRFLSHG